VQGDLDVDRLIAVLQVWEIHRASFVVSRHLGPACLAGCSQRGQPSRCRGAASISYAFPFLPVGTLPPKALPPTARGSSCASAPSALSEFLSFSVFLLLQFFCLCLNPVFDYRRAELLHGMEDFALDLHSPMVHSPVALTAWFDSIPLIARASCRRCVALLRPKRSICQGPRRAFSSLCERLKHIEESLAASNFERCRVLATATSHEADIVRLESANATLHAVGSDTLPSNPKP
jgi:hypothetical protein